MANRLRAAAVEHALRAVANDRRLLILHWLKDPRAHFRTQVDGDLVDDGVCGVLIAEKLGVSQPTVSEHLRVLARAGIVRGKRIKQWTFYKRNEKRIAELKELIVRTRSEPAQETSWNSNITSSTSSRSSRWKATRSRSFPTRAVSTRRRCSASRAS